MNRMEIPIGSFNTVATKIWQDALLLTAGENEVGKFNSMTIAWGSIGLMWAKPMVQVVVRPSRYTYEFMEKYDTFTICVLPLECKDTLKLLGTKSGRDSDKMKEANLTTIPSTKIAAPGYDEAELVIECKKIYYQDFNPDNFVDSQIEKMYGGKDYHRSYFGEIVAVYGAPKYSNC